MNLEIINCTTYEVSDFRKYCFRNLFYALWGNALSYRDKLKVCLRLMPEENVKEEMANYQQLMIPILNMLIHAPDNWLLPQAIIVFQ